MSRSRIPRRWPVIGATALIGLTLLSRLDARPPVETASAVPTGSGLATLLLVVVAGAALPRSTDRGSLRRGALLVAVGIWLLISSAGLGYSTSWPLLLVLIGTTFLIFPRRCEGRSSGVALIFAGGLMWIAIHGLWGLGWSTIWPLLLVVVGANIVWRSLFGKADDPCRPEERATEGPADE